MTSLVFIDVDGVLATPRSYDTILQANGQDYNSFAERAVANLNMVIEATGAKMVVSSTWRILYDLDTLRKIFSQERVKGSIIGATPDLPGGRGNQISEYLKSRAAGTPYVIIDDDVQDIKEEHPGKFVHIMGGWSGGHGMLKFHAEEAIRILQEGNPNV